MHTTRRDRGRRRGEGRKDKVASPGFPSLLSVLGGPLTRHAYKAVFIAVIPVALARPILKGRSRANIHPRSRDIIVLLAGEVAVTRRRQRSRIVDTPRSPETRGNARINPTRKLTRTLRILHLLPLTTDQHLCMKFTIGDDESKKKARSKENETKERIIRIRDLLYTLESLYISFCTICNILSHIITSVFLNIFCTCLRSFFKYVLFTFVRFFLSCDK